MRFAIFTLVMSLGSLAFATDVDKPAKIYLQLDLCRPTKQAFAVSDNGDLILTSSGTSLHPSNQMVALTLQPAFVNVVQLTWNDPYTCNKPKRDVIVFNEKKEIIGYGISSKNDWGKHGFAFTFEHETDTVETSAERY